MTERQFLRLELSASRREAIFYRTTLEQICGDTRDTRARRLAGSALLFWDEIQREARQSTALIFRKGKRK